ncbi:ATP-dependent RNA helicase HrpA [Pseudidiomarina mangrovi]|uniref:ATP-dependent RNA helicase HrpA n=1 Tax=Pseudidiomarina mangrovi TaxID=2487133 RepID=UPI001F0BE3B6|nr:ATP-dependent RNA helicase HrpA [Pseudidiomarina mangrovi]
MQQSTQSAAQAIIFPAELPVVQAKAEIQAAIAAHQVIIVAGETGSGKTTQLPKMLLEMGFGRAAEGTRIAHTQPRRLAARSVAQRIASELQSELGQRVGFKVRFSDQTTASTEIKLLTDGMLLAEVQQDSLLRGYDAIIIDEAHERSLNIDFLLGVLATILPKRPDLKLIITSATIETERFAKHFNHAPIITVEGRTFPVEVRYRPVTEDSSDSDDGDVVQAVVSAVRELQAEGPGDILVFASGEREIRDFAEALTEAELGDTELLPLFARLSTAEQNRIFQGHGNRRVVIATNVAETSLTVPGIRYVVDPGTARISRYSYRTKVQRLPIEKISQASANQRKGRCGRVAAGVCIRLYSEEDFLARPQYTDPEILRTNLAAVILQMTAARLGDIRKFPFIDRPDERYINDGLNLLQELHAIKSAPRRGKGPQLTALGQQLAQLPVDPRLARMIIAARDTGAVQEALVVTAALSIQDPRERPQQFQQKASELHARFHDKESDFVSYLKLWQYVHELEKSLSKNQFRKRLKEEFIHFLRIREWQDVYTQLRQTVRTLGFRLNTEAANYQALHQALLSGMLSQLGQKQDSHEFLGARNRKFYVFPGSGLFKKPPKWLMSAELVETSRLFARVNARIEPEWVEPLAMHLVKRSYFEPHFSANSGSVVADEQVTLYGLIIVPKRRVQYGPVDPVAARALFIREALVNGQLKRKLPFIAHNLALLDEVRELEEKSRRRDIVVDDEVLFAAYDQHIPAHVYNEQLLAGWWHQAVKQQPRLLFFERDTVMAQSADHITAADYPEFWQQGNLRLPLSYIFAPEDTADGVTVTVPLALLNQLQPDGFDWLVPAFRPALVTALIKSLPKSWRRNFVPAPNFAEAFCADDQANDPTKQPLIAALSEKLRRMTGVTVPTEAWDVSQVDNYLRMNFSVLNDSGQVVASSRDLSALQQQLQGRVKQALRQAVSTLAETPQAATDWQFGTLPEVLEQQQRGFAIKAYSALVPAAEGVRQELFDSAERAAFEHRTGLRKLLLLQLPSPIRHLQQSLSNRAKLAMYYNPWGKVDELIDDCIVAALDECIEQIGDVRDAQRFTRLYDLARAELNDRVTAMAQLVEPVLVLSQQLRKRLKGSMNLQLVQAYGDIAQQLDRLVKPGFVSAAGSARLRDIERYMKAVERRLDKVAVDPNKDRLHTLTIDALWQSYQQLLASWPKHKPQPEKLRELPWMIEELRVSFFAQQLGTRYPISQQRINQVLKELQQKS